MFLKAFVQLAALQRILHLSTIHVRISKYVTFIYDLDLFLHHIRTICNKIYKICWRRKVDVWRNQSMVAWLCLDLHWRVTICSWKTVPFQMSVIFNILLVCSNTRLRLGFRFIMGSNRWNHIFHDIKKIVSKFVIHYAIYNCINWRVQPHQEVTKASCDPASTCGTHLSKKSLVKVQNKLQNVTKQKGCYNDNKNHW